MNIGEALAYGLLGGTAAASEHYVEDWRDRTKRAHDLAAQREGWKYQTSEREAGEKVRAEEVKKEREFRVEQTRGQQFGLGADGKTIVPLKPDENGAMALPIGQTVGGIFSYLSGTDGKGLLKGGKGAGSKTSAGGPKSVKSGIGMNLSEGSVAVDEIGKEWQYVVNPQTNRWEKIPVETHETAPAVRTPEQMQEAEDFAQKTVDDLAGYFSTDASDFSAWGGSREATKAFFKRNYLNDTLFDEQGQLIMPHGTGQQTSTAPIAVSSETQQTPEETQNSIETASQIYNSLSPEKKQNLNLALKYLQSGTDIDALTQRMLELGFSEQELTVLGL